VLVSKPKPSSTRLPEGLVWGTFKGVKVLTSEMRNFVAERSANGTYSVLRINPRSIVARRLRLMDVLPTMRKYHNQDVEFAVRAAEHERETAAKTQQRIDDFENHPGFYVVPGETVGPDDTVYNADGPYVAFEKAGNVLSPDERWQAELEDYSVDDVEDAARATLKVHQNTPVMIVEAKNAREAAAGRGHVWWVNGSYKGPPVDPRQKGFGW
jgi:hypothetical protein